jgi:hypothetical protein
VFMETKAGLANKVEEGIKSFDPNLVTALLTDWCKHGVGSVLLQKHCSCPDKMEGSTNTLCCATGWPVCMVGSRFTHTAEANYSPTEGELLGVADALNKTKYFTMGCPRLVVGTDHLPLLGLLTDKHLDAIDNPCLVRLKQKTLGWQFTTVYIPGKLLRGTDALSRYGVRHCTEEEIHHIIHDDSPSDGRHLIGLMATATSNNTTPSLPLLLDTDTHLITSLSTKIRPVTWEEIKQLTSRYTHLQTLINLVQSSFPASRGDLPPDLRGFYSQPLCPKRLAYRGQIQPLEASL